MIPPGIGLQLPETVVPGRPHLDICPPSLQDPSFLTTPTAPAAAGPLLPGGHLACPGLREAAGLPDARHRLRHRRAPGHRDRRDRPARRDRGRRRRPGAAGGARRRADPASPSPPGCRRRSCSRTPTSWSTTAGAAPPSAPSPRGCRSCSCRRAPTSSPTPTRSPPRCRARQLRAAVTATPSPHRPASAGGKRSSRRGPQIAAEIARMPAPARGRPPPTRLRLRATYGPATQPRSTSSGSTTSSRTPRPRSSPRSGRAAAGDYDGLDDEALAARVTEAFLATSGDKHLRLLVRAPDHRAATTRRRPRPPGPRGSGSATTTSPPSSASTATWATSTCAASPPPATAAPRSTAAMELVAHTGALIFDLRRNRGGDPEGVQLWNSYLFPDSETHLNDIYDGTTNGPGSSGRCRSCPAAATWTAPSTC